MNGPRNGPITRALRIHGGHVGKSAVLHPVDYQTFNCIAVLVNLDGAGDPFEILGISQSSPNLGPLSGFGPLDRPNENEIGIRA